MAVYSHQKNRDVVCSCFYGLLPFDLGSGRRIYLFLLLQIVKENQVLHKGSLVIDGESACLADMNIFPGDVLWVTDSEIHEHRDIAGNTAMPNGCPDFLGGLQ